MPTAKETATFAADFGKGVQDGLGKLSDRPSSSKAAVEKPKAKPRTDVVTKSPFFKPGEKPATTKTGTTDPDPLKTFTDAVQKSMSDLLSGPKTAAEPKDSTEKTADDTPSADKPAA